MAKKLKKKKNIYIYIYIYIYSNEEELNSCIAHLREIVTELEEGEFKNIPEVLGIPATEHDCSETMIALAGSTRKRASIPSTSRKFYREREQFVLQKKSVKVVHEELKEEDFYPKFLGKVRLLRSRSEQSPP